MSKLFMKMMMIIICSNWCKIPHRTYSFDISDCINMPTVIRSERLDDDRNDHTLYDIVHNMKQNMKQNQWEKKQQLGNCRFSYSCSSLNFDCLYVCAQTNGQIANAFSFNDPTHAWTCSKLCWHNAVCIATVIRTK